MEREEIAAKANETVRDREAKRKELGEKLERLEGERQSLTDGTQAEEVGIVLPVLVEEEGKRS